MFSLVNVDPRVAVDDLSDQLDLLVAGDAQVHAIDDLLAVQDLLRDLCSSRSRHGGIPGRGAVHGARLEQLGGI